MHLAEFESNRRGEPLSSVGPIGRVPQGSSLRRTGDDLGFRREHLATVTQKICVSGADFEHELPQVISVFQQLDDLGQRLVLDCALAETGSS
jgi:hypothetical protein